MNKYKRSDPNYTTDTGRVFADPHEPGIKAAILADGLLSFAALADQLDAAGLRGLAGYCRNNSIHLGPDDMPTRRGFWIGAAEYLEALAAERLEERAPLLPPEADAAGEAFLDEQIAALEAQRRDDEAGS